MILIRLKPELDDYHQRRADKHGWLYMGKRKVMGLYEARSIATGVLCTFASEYVEEIPNAVQEPKGS